MTATRTHDAYGLVVSATGSHAGPFGFAGGHGYQENADSGLMLLGHRYRDPSTGRFLAGACLRLGDLGMGVVPTTL